MRKIIIITFSILALFNSLYAQTKDELIKVDKDFSDYSALHGTKDAFLKFIDDTGVLLRKNNYPVIGKEKIIAAFFTGDDGGYTLTWKPLFADISSSGELGYTYGIWNLDSKDEKGNPVNVKGTYVTIWKKDKEGIWKFVLDTGNSGLEPPKN
jgi:ketosteroid isomerase-like protein